MGINPRSFGPNPCSSGVSPVHLGVSPVHLRAPRINFHWFSLNCTTCIISRFCKMFVAEKVRSWFLFKNKPNSHFQTTLWIRIQIIQSNHKWHLEPLEPLSWQQFNKKPCTRGGASSISIFVYVLIRLCLFCATFGFSWVGVCDFFS